jgi:hypothetical protein
LESERNRLRVLGRTYRPRHAVRLAAARESGLRATEREEDSVDDERREGSDPLEREAERSTEEHLEEDVAQDLDLDEDEDGDDAGPSFDPARYLPPD